MESTEVNALNMTLRGSRVCEEKGRRGRGERRRRSLIDFKGQIRSPRIIGIQCDKLFPLPDQLRILLEARMGGSGRVLLQRPTWEMSLGDFIHRVVFLQVCTLRSIRIYVWIDTLNSARHSAKIRSFLPRCFRPLPQLDPPVDSARANDNAVTFAFARERFQVKSEVLFISWGKASIWQFNGVLF